MPAKIAVIQKPPVLLDRDGTIGKAIEAIDEAADAGASLLVFPEAWFPSYPTWVWRLKPGADMALSGELHARLRQTQSISSVGICSRCRCHCMRNILGSIGLWVKADHAQRIAVLAGHQIGNGGLIVGPVEISFRERGAEPAVIIDDDVIILGRTRNNRGPFTHTQLPLYGQSLRGQGWGWDSLFRMKGLPSGSTCDAATSRRKTSVSHGIRAISAIESA